MSAGEPVCRECGGALVAKHRGPLITLGELTQRFLCKDRHDTLLESRLWPNVPELEE